MRPESLENAVNEIDERYIESYLKEQQSLKLQRRKRIGAAAGSLIAGVLLGILLFAFGFNVALAKNEAGEPVKNEQAVLKPDLLAEQVKRIPVTDLPDIWERVLNDSEYRAEGILFIESVLSIRCRGGQIGEERQETWIKDFISRKNYVPGEYGDSEKVLYGGLMLPGLYEKSTEGPLREEEASIVVALARNAEGFKGIRPLKSSMDEKDSASAWLKENREFIKMIRRLISPDAL